ncbi:MAG: ABC transporter permease subunit [Spirochaetaceae bacterium]|jgi:NitT/TauT family transport system permease protein|nr:ABC transporter permease subunit [Spirochaetaceae bacterium]
MKLKQTSLKGQKNEGGNHLGAAGIFVGLFAAYSLLTDVSSTLDPFLFPGLLKVGKALINSAPLLFKGFISSLLLLLPALLVSFVAGIGAGSFIGLNKRARDLLMPLFRALNPIPSTMLIPYAIAILPTFRVASIAIIAIGVFWPVVRNTVNGITYLEPRWIDNARCLNIRGPKLLFKIILPGAMPQIFTGIESGLILSFIILTVAEIFGARAGLGYFVQYYADFAEYDRVMAGMFVLSLTVVVIMFIFDRVRRRVLPWTN